MRTLNRDGVALYYDEDGAGDPPIVLIHGWCCDHTYLAPQFDHLRTEHRVIALDLRGHGRSDKPDQEYSIAGFAGDVNWLLGELGVNGAVVIGHSMGGLVALELAARHPERTAGVVTLDSPLFRPEAARTRMRDLVTVLRTPEYRATAERVVSGMFLPGIDDPDRRARIIAAMSAAPQHVMAGAMQAIATFDDEGAAAACKAPVLAIAAAGSATDVERFRSLCPSLTTAQTACAGHFHQLETPDQVNAMIDRFLRTSVTAAAVLR